MLNYLIINFLENVNFLENEESTILIKTTFVEKNNIDRSALYSFDGPFQLLHADLVT